MDVYVHPRVCIHLTRVDANDSSLASYFPPETPVTPSIYSGLVSRNLPFLNSVDVFLFFSCLCNNVLTIACNFTDVLAV